MKTEKDKMFQVESKIRQKKSDDKTRREQRNRQVSFLLTEKVDVSIGVIGKQKLIHIFGSDRAGSSVEETDVYGASVTFETNDGTCVMNFTGKNKNGADRLVRLFMDRVGVKYKIRRGE